MQHEKEKPVDSGSGLDEATRRDFVKRGPVEKEPDPKPYRSWEADETEHNNDTAF